MAQCPLLNQLESVVSSSAQHPDERSHPHGPMRDASGRLLWSFGANDVPLDDLLGKHPDLVGDAALASLLGTGPLPKEDISAELVRTNVAALMPDLELVIAARQAFDESFFDRADMDPRAYNALLTVPLKKDDRWTLLLQSSDPAGAYVCTDLLLSLLGQYALFRAARLEHVETLDVSRVAGYDEVALLLAGGGDRPGEDDILKALSCLAAYVLGHFMNLDPRRMTFSLLRDSLHSQVMQELFAALMRDRRQVVATERGMAEALGPTGMTREGWLMATEDTRHRWIADGTLTLLQHRDGRARPRATAPVKRAVFADGRTQSVH